MSQQGSAADKKLGLFGAGALVAGNIVGSGIFLLPATLAAFGSITLVSWGIGTAGFMALGLVFAALVRVRPQAENLVAQVRDGTGPFFGFQAVVLYWVSCLTGNVAIAVASAGYLGVFIHSLNTPWGTGLTATGILALMTASNLLGPKFIGRISGLSIVLGLIPIFVVGAVGWLWFDPGLWAKSWNVSHTPAAEAVTHSLVQVSLGLLGVESAAIAAKVVRDPERNIGPATLGGVAAAALVYVAACTVVFGLLPADQLARSAAPFADVMSRQLGPVAGAVIAACALAKTVGCLGGWVLVTSETSESATDEGMLPKVFGRSARGVVPARKGLIVNLVLMAAVAIATISPSLAKQYAAIIGFTVDTNFVIYALASIALIRFASRMGDRLVALAALVFCIVVVAYSGLDTLKLTGLTLVVTTALFIGMALVKALTRPRRQPA